MEYAEIQCVLLEAIKKSGTNPFRAATSAGLPGTAIRHALEGHEPKAGRLVEIARALGLEFYIGPPRDGSDGGTASSATSAAPQTARLDTFNPDIDVIVRGYAKCSLVGHMEGEEQYRDLPMPSGLREIDADGFYVMAKGPSMIPEGINEGDYCLVSPNTPLAAGLRVWLKDRQGKACIKRLMEITDRTYRLRGWQAPLGGRQTNYDDEWMATNITEKGVVLAVYRGKPDVGNPPEIIPDPRVPTTPQATTLPQEILTALDLPEGASVADVVKAIEAHSQGGFDTAVLEERVAAAIKTETESLRADVVAVREAQAETLRTEMSAVRADIADLSDSSALASDNDDEPSGARPVDVIELDSAAGGGAAALSEDISGRAWFRRDWLDEHGLDAGSCAIIGVAGESMEPTLMDGSRILVDRNRTTPRGGDIFVLRTQDGLVVKRVGKDGAGGWLLASDHPAWDDVPLPDDAEIIGRVVWTARTLVKE